MTKTLKDLALALLNATLLLIALCLLLAWMAAGRVEAVTATLSANLERVAPLRAEIGATAEELAGLRGDLAALAAQGGELSSERLVALETRIDRLQGRLDGARERFDALASDPGLLLDRAIETGATEFARAVNDIRGCGKPES